MKAYKISLLAAALILAGCAKETGTDTSAAAKNYFESWVQIHYPQDQYPDVRKEGSGIYILEDTPGTGDAIDPGATPYVFVDYTVTDLEGNVSSTSIESVSKRIGGYSAANTYGPRIWYAGSDTYGVYAGVEALLTGMRKGGTRKAAVPYWLCTTKRYANEAAYLKNITSGNSLIYEVTLHDATDDINKYQGDLLDAYAKAHLAGADSTHIAGNEELGKFGFYYYTVSPGSKPKYTMPGDTTMYLNYTGKLLDGKVFDTTDASEAKRAGIYNASRSYAPVQITRSSTYTDIAMGGSSDLVSGFQAAIYMMHPMEKAITAFYSPLGYGATGSGMTILPYTPIVFELELVEQP